MPPESRNSKATLPRNTRVQQWVLWNTSGWLGVGKICKKQDNSPFKISNLQTNNFNCSHSDSSKSNKNKHTSFETWRFCQRRDRKNLNLFLFPLHPGAFWPAANQREQKRNPSWRYEGQRPSLSICGGLDGHVTSRECRSETQTIYIILVIIFNNNL